MKRTIMITDKFLCWLQPLLRNPLSLALLGAMLPLVAAAQDEKTFASPQEAIDALVTAAKTNDLEAIHTIFGPTGHELVSPDLVQADDDYKIFVQRLSEKTQVINHSDTHITLDLGKEAWPFPIPLVKNGDKWFFDTAAGREEIFARRIGANELGAIDVCYSYIAAQREYASEDRQGEGILAYAQLLQSTPGKHDGLYWPQQAGEELSPFGPLVAQAHIEGYHHTVKEVNEHKFPYHGYYFKILTSQGSLAPGGAYNYIINGHMIAGFAMIAWPAEWGDTGVMTFIVNQQGKVYQRNLGSATFDIAENVSTYPLNDTWTPVETDASFLAQRTNADSSLKAVPSPHAGGASR